MALSPRLLRPRATPSAGFDPRTISGLQVWWDASDEASLGTATSGPGGVSNNSPVRYLGDKSGNGRNMLQPGADSLCPVLVQNAQNGRSVLAFGESSASWMECLFSLEVTEQTFFLVLRDANIQSNERYWSQQVDDTNDYNDANIHTPFTRNGNNAQIASVTNAGNVGLLSLPNSQWLVACSRHTGSQIQNSLNNGTAATGSHTLNRTIQRMLLGVYRATSTVIADATTSRMSEWLMWNRSLSDAERGTVARALGAKWGVTVA